MTSSLNDLRARLPGGQRLYSVMAAAIIGLILIGCALYSVSSIMPQVKAWNALSAELEAMQRTLQEAQRAQASSPEALQKEIEAALARRSKAGQLLFSEAQAEELAQRLHEYTAGTGVEIISLQSQPGQKATTQTIGLRSYALQAAGPLPGLMRFISQIREARLQGCSLAGMNIAGTKKEGLYSLSLQVVVYTSPYAPQGPLAAGAGGVQPLESALAGAWAEGQWPQVIALIEQILALDPAREGMTDKLYAAHVNYGYRLYGEGNAPAAVSEFQAALRIKAGGQEAEEGLRQAGAPPAPQATVPPAPSATPAPAYILYTVRSKDTLYSLARRYNTTPEAIMAANGLSDSRIRAGDSLRIPTQ